MVRDLVTARGVFDIPAPTVRFESVFICVHLWPNAAKNGIEILAALGTICGFIAINLYI